MKVWCETNADEKNSLVKSAIQQETATWGGGSRQRTHPIDKMSIFAENKIR